MRYIITTVLLTLSASAFTADDLTHDVKTIDPRAAEIASRMAQWRKENPSIHFTPQIEESLRGEIQQEIDKEASQKAFGAKPLDEQRAIALETARANYKYISNAKLKGWKENVWGSQQANLDKLKKRFSFTDDEIGGTPAAAVDQAAALRDEGFALIKKYDLAGAKKKFLAANELVPGTIKDTSDAAVQQLAQTFQNAADAKRMNDAANQPRRSRTGE